MIKTIEEFKLYHHELDNLNNKIQNLEMEKKKLVKSEIKIKEQLVRIQKERMELSQELSKIYNSKGWKYLERFRNLSIK